MKGFLIVGGVRRGQGERGGGKKMKIKDLNSFAAYE